MDRIEFYEGASRHPMAGVDSSMLPHVGSRISIRQKTWKVIGVTFALDHIDEPSLRGMRANVVLRNTQEK